ATTAVKSTVTVLLATAGSNTPGEVARVVYVVLSVLVSTENGWLRAFQTARGGSFRITRPIGIAAPRSTVRLWGKVPLTLSQYELGFPSTALVAGKPPSALLAEMGLPAAWLPVSTRPLPVRATASGLPALLAMVSVPVRPPPADGAKATPTVQLAPAARLAPQPLDWIANSALVLVMPVSVVVAVPGLLTVTVCAALVMPTVTVPKSRLAGADAIAGPEIVPLPERGTATSPPNESVPVREPAADGRKVTPTVQLAPMARLAPQLLDWMANSALPVVMLLRLAAPVPELVTVTVRAALVVATACAPNERLVGLATSVARA